MGLEEEQVNRSGLRRGFKSGSMNINELVTSEVFPDIRYMCPNIGKLTL
jgi:hypothetical protein